MQFLESCVPPEIWVQKWQEGIRVVKILARSGL